MTCFLESINKRKLINLITRIKENKSKMLETQN